MCRQWNECALKSQSTPIYLPVLRNRGGTKSMGHTTHIKLVLGMLKAIRVLGMCVRVCSAVYLSISLSLALSLALSVCVCICKLCTHMHLYGFKEGEHAMASNLNTFSHPLPPLGSWLGTKGPVSRGARLLKGYGNAVHRRSWRESVLELCQM